MSEQRKFIDAAIDRSDKNFGPTALTVALREFLQQHDQLVLRADRCACNAFAKTAVERGAPFDPAIHCPKCSGRGMVPSDNALRFDGMEAWARPDQTCPDCKGDGFK